MEIPKKGILMAYVSDHKKWFGMGFPKKEILIDYISRSHNPPKMKITGGVNAYISRLCDFLKKEILMDYISIFGRHFPKNYQKRKFDSLYKQVT